MRTCARRSSPPSTKRNARPSKNFKGFLLKRIQPKPFFFRYDTIIEEKCETTYETTYEEVCETVYDTEFDTKCETVYETVTEKKCELK